MADLQKIVDDLSRLTVAESADLARLLKQKWSSAGSEPGARILFEARERTRMEPRRRGETLFDFYDSCAMPGYAEFRSVVNGWLAEMPANDRDELISRMQYGGDREFGASLSELSLHAFIVGSGYRASVHPNLPGTTKRLDYAAASQAGEPLTYVEVTTRQPARGTKSGGEPGEPGLQRDRRRQDSGGVYPWIQIGARREEQPGATASRCRRRALGS